MSTNKAFQYIFNTTQEDQKVAKVLSGWDPKAHVPATNLCSFDAMTRTKVDSFKSDLFAGCSGLVQSHLNVTPAVVDVLCAHLIKSFPELKAMNNSSPLVKRVEDALSVAGVEHDELIAWAVHLIKQTSACEDTEKKLETKDTSLMKAQAAVIDELLGITNNLSKRIREVEAQLGDDAREHTPQQDSTRVSEVPVVKKRRKCASTNLVDTWYEWFAKRGHSSSDVARQKKSDMRSVVGFMLLFAGNFALDEAAVDSRPGPGLGQSN